MSGQFYVLNHYQTADKKSCSRTQHIKSTSRESRACKLSTSSLSLGYGKLKALPYYNVLANACRRMNYISSTLAYAEISIKNQRKPLSDLMQSVRETNIERMSNL